MGSFALLVHARRTGGGGGGGGGGGEGGALPLRVWGGSDPAHSFVRVEDVLQQLRPPALNGRPRGRSAGARGERSATAGLAWEVAPGARLVMVELLVDGGEAFELEVT